MNKRSNRYLKYCARNDCLDLPYQQCKIFASTCSYRFLVSVVVLTGILDVVGGCGLLYACAEMLVVLKDLEEFNRLFPTITGALVKGFSQITEALLGHHKNDGYNVEEYAYLMQVVILIYKTAFVLLMGVALFFLILSVILFVGIYKKNSTCCFIWTICQCMLILIYFLQGVVVSSFNVFDPIRNTMRGQYVVMVCAYWFYRLGTVVAVHRFQRKFLFYSKLNQCSSWYMHED